MIDLSTVFSQEQRDILTALYNHQLNHLTSNPVLAVGDPTDHVAVGAFSYKLGGVTYNKGADVDAVLPASTNTSTQFSKDLLTIDAAGTVAAVAGVKATSQALAELPAAPAGTLAIGYLEVPNSFTPDTTVVTSGMIKNFTEVIDFTP